VGIDNYPHTGDSCTWKLKVEVSDERDDCQDKLTRVCSKWTCNISEVIKNMFITPKEVEYYLQKVGYVIWLMGFPIIALLVKIDRDKK
jgi:hypothetical protein